MRIAINLNGIKKNSKYKLFREAGQKFLSIIGNLSMNGHEIYVYDEDRLKKIDRSLFNHAKEADIQHLYIMTTDPTQYKKSLKRNSIDLEIDDALNDILLDSSSVEDFSEKLNKYISDSMVEVLKPLQDGTQEKTGIPSIDKPWEQYQLTGAKKKAEIWYSPYQRFVEANKDFENNYFISDALFGTKFTYKEIFERIDETADGFRALGIKEGSKVPVVLSSNIEMFIIIEALYKVKATIIPLYPKAKVEEIKSKLEDIDYDYIIAHDLFYKNVSLGKKTNSKIVVIPFTYSAPPVGKTLYKLVLKPEMNFEKIEYNDDVLKYDDVKKMGYDTDFDYDLSYDENYEALILFTSGTTSNKPKSVILTAKNLEAAFHANPTLEAPIYRDDTLSCFLPINHVFGLVSVLYLGSAIGAKFSMTPKFNFENVDKLLINDGTSVFVGIPMMVDSILNNPKIMVAEEGKIKTRMFVLGGDKVTAEKKQEIQEFGKQHGLNVIVLDGYGATETSAAFLYDSKLVVGDEVKIINPETKHENPYGVVGEIYISGDTVTPGYGDLSLNDKHFVIDAGKKWLATGDMGYIDQNGKIITLGRLDDQIKIKGEKVILGQISKKIKECFVVEDCVTVARQEGNDNCIVASIVLKENLILNDDILKTILQFYKDNIPKSFERPTITLCYKKFPLNQNGKIDMKQMKATAQLPLDRLKICPNIDVISNEPENYERVQKKN